jgi:hypothetical protein
MLALVDGTRIPGGVIAFGDEGRDGASDRDRRGAARTRTPVAGCSPTIAGLAPPRPGLADLGRHRRDTSGRPARPDRRQSAQASRAITRREARAALLDAAALEATRSVCIRGTQRFVWWRLSLGVIASGRRLRVHLTRQVRQLPGEAWSSSVVGAARGAGLATGAGPSVSS